MHICTAGMLRLHTPSTHIPPSHLRGTLFSCPQRHTPGLETWEMWGQPKAETQEIPQQKPCHMPKPRPLSGQGSEDREDWGGSLGVGKVLPAGELVLAVGFALTPLPQGCQGAEALALALGALALQAPLLQVSPGRGGGGGAAATRALPLSGCVAQGKLPSYSCPHQGNGLEEVTRFLEPVPRCMHLHTLLQRPDICYILQGPWPPPSSLPRKGQDAAEQNSALSSSSSSQPVPGDPKPLLSPPLQSLCVPTVCRGAGGQDLEWGCGMVCQGVQRARSN